MEGSRSWTAVTGLAVPVVLLATFALATASPAFDAPSDPFSVAGAGDGAVAVAFNAGLVFGGLLALAFAPRLAEVYGRTVAILYGAVGASFAAAGVFPIGSGLHEIAAVAFLGIPLLLVAAGLVDWRAGRHRVGLGAVTLGALSLAVWLPYDLGLDSLQVGYAVAECVSVAALAPWSVQVARGMQSSDDAVVRADA